jgi:hypothetical protein
MPIGTLSQKIQCQLMPLTMAPPTTGPRATPRPLIPPHRPMAAPRFSAGKASLISVSVSGKTIAAPAPCTARAPSSTATLGESAAAADAAMKRNRPTAYMRRRPKRSPSAAPVSRRQANARLYAFTVHSRLCRLACRSSRSAGSDVVTTSVSSAVMKTPSEARITVHVVLVMSSLLVGWQPPV